jgi:hypothetical protein
MFSLNHMGLTVDSIPSIILILIRFCLLRWVRYSGWGIAILTLIGTISHEVLHAAVGWVVYAKPTSFSIIPRREKNYWMLGSVGFRNLNIWNSAPVAFAPLLLAWVSWFNIMILPRNVFFSDWRSAFSDDASPAPAPS